ncbi:unnamed protein product [Bathycoccus prasinos]|mmetsp:Transcript_1292/g.4788  ORF Transcript_1292/g.4788 Transcript_1292/m.4788 type:complete len:448 (+) Transcript_1292:49-1392(+)
MRATTSSFATTSASSITDTLALKKQQKKMRANAGVRCGATKSSSSSSDDQTKDKKIVILGGGLQGLASAYFLCSERGCTNVTLVERCDKVAPAASGKAGGFLSPGGWGNKQTRELHTKSFELHEKLAKDLDVTSFRKIRTLSVQAGESGLADPLVEWLDGDIQQNSVLDENTAQVTPSELSSKLHESATKNGLKTLYSTECTGISFKDEARSVVNGVHVKNKSDDSQSITLECDVVVVAMGPWTTRAASWFLDADFPMTGIKSTSIVFEASDAVKSNPAALFCAEDPRFQTHLEVYPRVDGSVYLCGIGGSDYVDEDRLAPGGDCESADLIKADPSRVQAAWDSFKSMSPSVGSSPPILTQACMRPCAPDALPFLGKLPNVENAIVASAHNCWGILWAPITGQIVSELIMDGKSSCNLEHFSPGRFARPATNGRGRKKGILSVGEQW